MIRILKFSMICSTALLLAASYAAEKKASNNESKNKNAQTAPAIADAEIDLAVKGMT